MSYTDLTIKTIYGRSYNECNHPDCERLIIAIDKLTKKVVNHGEMAHIRAQNEGGERWDPNYPTSDLNKPDNLILLCADHHKVIDQKDAGEHYTVELLNDWKNQHYLQKEIDEDREWVYGPSSLHFAVEGVQYRLDYWRDKHNNLRFFTPEQLQKANAAKDISLCIAQLSSLLSRIESADITPSDPSHQSMNDSIMKALKNDVDQLKTSWISKESYENAMHRLYSNFNDSGDITLKELSLVGSTEKSSSQTILVGEASKQRVDEALHNPKKK